MNLMPEQIGFSTSNPAKQERVETAGVPRFRLVSAGLCPVSARFRPAVSALFHHVSPRFRCHSRRFRNVSPPLVVGSGCIMFHPLWYIFTTLVVSRTRHCVREEARGSIERIKDGSHQQHRLQQPVPPSVGSRQLAE